MRKVINGGAASHLAGWFVVSCLVHHRRLVTTIPAAKVVDSMHWKEQDVQRKKVKQLG